MTGVAAQRRMAAADWLLLGFLSLLWGGSFFFVALAVGSVPPLTLVALRVGLAAAILLAVLRIAGIAPPRGRTAWAALAGMALLNNIVPFCLIVWGQTRIGSGLASMLNATTPLFGVVAAHLLLPDERLTRAKAAGVMLGAAGIAAMVGPAILSAPGDLAGQAAVLGAAISYAAAGIFGRRFAAIGLDPVTTAAGQLTASTLLLGPVALAVDRPWTLPMPGATVWLAVAGLATLSTALAYVVFFRLLARAGAGNLLLVTFLIPVSATLLGVLVLGEAVTGRQIAGMAAVAAGLACIDGRIFARRRGTAERQARRLPKSMNRMSSRRTRPRPPDGP